MDEKRRCGDRACAANDGRGLCRALNNTAFGNRLCPFYKSRERNDQECAAVLSRLRAMGAPGIQRIGIYYLGASKPNAD